MEEESVTLAAALDSFGEFYRKRKKQNPLRKPDYLDLMFEAASKYVAIKSELKLLVGEALFLIERLEEYGADEADAVDDFCCHVEPAKERLDNTISRPEKKGA